MATEYLDEVDGLPGRPRLRSPGSSATVEDRITGRYDHDLFFARVTRLATGRLGEPPLLYSSRLGWRAAGGRVREPGGAVRDRLLARLEDPTEA